ncbi:hypothetical protein BP6252_11914 [Coleophoma cylindrospora]|uniref:Uncharacterized protein n=1 Tax=Coleophoma cylindrospora TaxID=1849047 RepID=A0A3D8QFN5_9HELO|nr:hypothetical protein BP6252_11914 [Coleophoma cylindrospora]
MADATPSLANNYNHQDLAFETLPEQENYHETPQDPVQDFQHHGFLKPDKKRLSSHSTPGTRSTWSTNGSTDLTTTARPASAELHRTEKREEKIGSNEWRGRHSNDWLFGNFSIRATVRKVGRKVVRSVR